MDALDTIIGIHLTTGQITAGGITIHGTPHITTAITIHGTAAGMAGTHLITVGEIHIMVMEMDTTGDITTGITMAIGMVTMMVIMEMVTEDFMTTITVDILAITTTAIMVTTQEQAAVTAVQPV